jgi:putative endonuclease
MFFVYILFSQKCDRYYVGYSADPENRLSQRHNKGKVRATKNCAPYILMAKKEFQLESEARKEEIRLKRMKSRKYLIELIEGKW